jgi:hypothetical protein
MKPRHLALLTAVTAALLLLAFWSQSARRARPPSCVGQPVLPGLDVNAVRAIEIRKGAESLLVARRGDEWVVTNAFNYPADFKKLGENLLALQDLKIGHVRPGASVAADSATHVRLLGENDQSLAGLLLGEQRQRASSGEMSWSSAEGRYLAREGDPRTFLVKENLDAFGTSAKEWLNAEILNVPAADVRTVQLHGSGAETVTLDRTSGSLQLTGLATNEEFDTSRSYGLESALSYLRFNDVASPALDEGTTGLVTGRFYRATLGNGEVYTARVGGTSPAGSDRYARFAVELLPAGTNVTANPAGEDARKRKEQEERVAGLQRSLAPWTFLISSYTAENMTRTRAELVKPRPPQTNSVPEAAAAAGDAPPAATATPAAP